jgi:hypothetical protein
VEKERKGTCVIVLSSVFAAVAAIAWHTTADDTSGISNALYVVSLLYSSSCALVNIIILSHDLRSR